jgi:maleylacetoacetate isomerase
MLKLYTYFRSSAAFRVRIALNLKGLDYEAVPVHLLRGGGEQHGGRYDSVNPQHLVPSLEDEGLTLGQSLAIIEYLDERHPAPSLLPREPSARARVRELALSVACDIHPLNNTRVLGYLAKTLSLDEEMRNEWARHWIALGFAAIDRRLAANSNDGPYCFGAAPTLADCCLIPQVFNAHRVQLPLEPYSNIRRVHDHCMQQEAFQRAAPGAQGDAE